MVREFSEEVDEFKPAQILGKREGETEAEFWIRAKRHTEKAAEIQEGGLLGMDTFRRAKNAEWNEDPRGLRPVVTTETIPRKDLFMRIKDDISGVSNMEVNHKEEYRAEEKLEMAKNTPGVSTSEIKPPNVFHWHNPSRETYREFADRVKDLEANSHPLYPVFTAAIAQCTHGKGERHGGCATSFLEQPWHHYAKLHGRGFLTGQAAKKLEEAASTREGEAFINEMLGAIVYLGMAILNEQEKMKDES